MVISNKTKISKIIAENKDAIDVIASINKNFKKLKNPFLRKLLAPRVSVEDAAKVGNIRPELLLKKLSEIGFEIENIDSNTENKPKKTQKMNRKEIVELDVRPILSGGIDPFNEIMKTLKTLSDDQTLLIINTFEPVPLLNKLKTKGYEYEVERPNDSIVHTYLAKSKTEVEVLESKNTLELSFKDAEAKFKGKMNELDVRDLEMPLPMVSILEEIEKLTKNEALFVHHKRLPQYLLPELETRGFIFSKKEIDDNNLKLIIYKAE